MTIRLLEIERMDEFLTYLSDHISDNGKDNTDLFLPISRSELNISKDLVNSFKNGQSIRIGELYWRRVFIAENKNNKIVGHIDLKSLNQKYTKHRAMMGMGVHRDYRSEGLGRLLIEFMLNWVKKKTEIDYIDLWVLAQNYRAIRLYNKMGFREIGQINDMFRMDGQSHNFLMMTMRPS